MSDRLLDAFNSYVKTGEAPKLNIPVAPGVSSGGDSSTGVAGPFTPSQAVPASDLASSKAVAEAAGKTDAKQAETSTKQDIEASAPAGDEQPESTETSPAATDKKPAVAEASNTEKITVTDARGRKTQIEVDFSNRESVRKFVTDAHNFQNGFRKMQAERDSLRGEHTKLSEDMKKLQENFGVLENAYKNQGVEGVIDLLTADSGGYKSWEKKMLERSEFLRNASPEEIRAFQANEIAEKTRRDAESLKREFEEYKKNINAEKEQAELARAEAQVHPIFEKYRFAGKLGDDADEQMFDKMLWKTAMDNLEDEAKLNPGFKPTPELIEDEFRVVSNTLRKRIQNQVEKKTQRVVEKKKSDALESVQTQAKSEYNNQDAGTQAEVRDILSSGNYTKLMTNWGKYKGILGRR